MLDFSRVAKKSPFLVKTPDGQQWFIPPLSAGVELRIRQLQATMFQQPVEYWALLIESCVTDPVLDAQDLVKNSSVRFLEKVASDILEQFPLWEPPEEEESEKRVEKRRTPEETVEALEVFLCSVAYDYGVTLGELLDKNRMEHVQLMASNVQRFKDEYFLDLSLAAFGHYKPKFNGKGGAKASFDDRMARLHRVGNRLLGNLGRR